MTGRLALVEALRGRLGRAAELASQAAATASERRPSGLGPAPLVALAWVHLARNELRETRNVVKRADAALGASPDKLIGAAAYLVAASGALAEGRPRGSYPDHRPSSVRVVRSGLAGRAAVRPSREHVRWPATSRGL